MPLVEKKSGELPIFPVHNNWLAETKGLSVQSFGIEIFSI